MVNVRVVLLPALVCLLISCNQQRSSSLYIEPTIEAELRQVQAIDNHAHPEKVVSLGEEDREFDALPADSIQEPSLPTPFREDSPYFPQAWRALFNYGFSDSKPDHLASLEKAKRDIKAQKGDLYPVWVLNRAETEIMLANRVAMGRGLPSDRFKWVPFVDMLLFPLSNNAIKAKDPEHKAFMANEEMLLKSYLQSAGLSKLPASLEDYQTFVSHILEHWKGSGAVALKFELAYLRDLQISNPPRESAQRIYSIFARSSEPSPEEYKILQDYLFRHIATEAGRLRLPIHIHCSIGVGSYFRAANADPMALEGLFNDPALRRTKFVMLHGSWPYAREAAALILKPNVYVDTSAFMYLTYPSEAARAIRNYLEAAPEKVLYASDASPFTNHVGWEETLWIGARNGRQALGLALTGMLRDEEISSDRARQLVHQVMRENARQLYGF